MFNACFFGRSYNYTAGRTYLGIGGVVLSGELVEVLKKEAKISGELKIVSLAFCRKAAAEFSVKQRQVELIALENGICPSRYHRNIGTFGISGQIRLLKSKAAVIGCGGLGGWIIEILTRAGVGEMVLVDMDVFDDSNLNRQLFSTEENIGRSKAEAAAERAALINGSVDAYPKMIFFNEENGTELLEGCSVVIDALDNNKSRRAAFRICAAMGIPFVHGAIGGPFGQTGVFCPEDVPLWESCDVPDKGVETDLGNPPYTAAFVAALQASLAIRILASPVSPVRKELFCFDLHNFESQKIRTCRGTDGSRSSERRHI